MAVISITITESPLELVDGIPVSVTLETNVPATIFFTLDGTEPTTSSSVVTGPIKLPTDQNTVTLKAFATDGVDTSSTITQQYGSSSVANRNPHDTVSGLNNLDGTAQFPFGSEDPGGPGIFGNTGGVIVDDPTISGISTGFDGTGTGTSSGETDVPLSELDIIYSETNKIGQRGSGLGTLPAEAIAILPEPIQELSVASGSNDPNSPIFNPKSLVIFQDSREEPYDPDVPRVNRPYFYLGNKERTRDGSFLHLSAFDGSPPLGSALKQQYNPRDGTITYYYRDQETNRWIISKTSFSPKDNSVVNLSSIVFGRDKPTAKVFRWQPFKYRTLW